MPDNAARYEFRIWRDRVDEIADRLEAMSEHVEQRDSTDTYFVSTATVAANPKARADLLDIKVLKAEVDGFQQWGVDLKSDFPVVAELVRDELFRLLEVPVPPLDRSRYSLHELLDLVVAPHPDVAAVEVVKRRDLRQMSECSAEITHATIGHRAFTSVAVESADLAALQAATQAIGLTGERNVSYPQAIRDRLGGRFAR